MTDEVVSETTETLPASPPSAEPDAAELTPSEDVAVSVAAEEEVPEPVSETPAEELAPTEEADVEAKIVEPPASALPSPTAAVEVPPPAEEPELPPKEEKKRWYVVKVQSNREDSIKAALERRVKIEGLEEFFGEVLIPTEKVVVEKEVTERNKLGEKVKKKKKVFKDVKKFPGYLFAFVEYNLQVLALFRETSGVGDFVGASLTRDPIPMSDREVASMLKNRENVEPTPVIPQITFNRGDRVKVRDGSFAGMEGEVKDIIEPKDAKDTHKVKLELTILGRSVPVELEHWQVEAT